MPELDEGASGSYGSYSNDELDDPRELLPVLQTSVETTGVGGDWLESIGLKQSDIDSSSPAMSGDPLAGIPTGSQDSSFLGLLKSWANSAGGSIKDAYNKDPGAFLRDFMKMGLGGIAQAYNNKAADERQQKVLDFQQKQIDDRIARNNASITPYKGIIATMRGE